MALIERRLANKSAPSTPLHLVHPRTAAMTQGMDQVTRDSHLRMVQHLRHRYRDFGAQLLIDQATFGRSGLHDLEGEELAKLHHDLHRAMECALEGVSLEEAGLLHEPPGAP